MPMYKREPAGELAGWAGLRGWPTSQAAASSMHITSSHLLVPLPAPSTDLWPSQPLRPCLPAVAMALGLTGAAYWYWSTNKEQAQKQGEPGRRQEPVASPWVSSRA